MSMKTDPLFSMKTEPLFPKFAIKYKFPCNDSSFDVSGFKVVDEAEWSAMEKYFTKTDDIEIYFGENEVLRFEKGVEILREMKVVPVTAIDATFLENHVGSIDDGLIFEYFEFINQRENIEKKMIVAKYKIDYADEFDVSGFDVMEDSDWLDMVDFYKNKSNLEIYFGTNEYLKFMTGEQVIDKISITPVTLAEARILRKHIGTIDDGGIFRYFEYRGYDDYDD